MNDSRQSFLSDKTIPYILIAPVFIYYLAFWMRPVLSAIGGSFVSVEGELTLQNYAIVFRDPYFRKALFNTFFIVAVSVTVEFLLAFGLALLINVKFKGSGIFLFIALIPMTLPAVAVGAMWSSGLAAHGWLNSLLCRIGVLAPDVQLEYLSGGPFASMFLIILIDAWQVIPFMMVILLAGMQNLRPELREAGYVFGGSSFTVLRKITTPLLKSTIHTALILRIISAIQIWLIIVMLYGFRRVPVLLEELVFYSEVLSGPQHFKTALAYSVIVAVIVSTMAVLYLKVSGATKEQEYSA